MAGTRTQFLGDSATHLNFFGAAYNFHHFISLPRPVGEPVRTWCPSATGSTSDLSVETSTARLYTWTVDVGGEDSIGPVMQALAFSSERAALKYPDHRFLPHEFVRDFFINKGQEFIITECRSESSVRIYQVVGQRLELKSEFLQGPAGCPPLITYDLENHKLFVLEQGVETTNSLQEAMDNNPDIAAAIGDITLIGELSLTLSVFTFDDLEVPVLKRRLVGPSSDRSGLHVNDPCQSILFDQRSGICLCFTSRSMYYFSQSDYTLRFSSSLSLRTSGWRYSGQHKLVPGTRYLMSSLQQLGTDGASKSQSFLQLVAFTVDETEDGSSKFRLFVRDYIDVVPHDDISIAVDTTQKGSARMSLELWRYKNPLSINDVSRLRGGRDISVPPLPYDSPSESDDQYTKLKWPLFDLDS